MGGRGYFLKEGGFVKTRYKTVGFIESIKILRPKDDREKLSLPERSGSPNASYVSYHDDGTFRQFITFDKNRMPKYQIDYTKHRGQLFLHVHFYKNGDRDNEPKKLKPGDKLYERHQNLFKGVPVPDERN